MKTKQEIVSELFKDGTIRELIENVARRSLDFNLQDLEQDIYISLLEKEEKKIQELYSNSQLRFFLTRMITNNLISVNSPYYTKYRKFSALSEEIQQEDIDDD